MVTIFWRFARFRFNRHMGLVALLLPWYVAAGATEGGSVVTMRSAPDRPVIELRDGMQRLNFDIVVRDVSSVSLRITDIELSVYGEDHQLALRRSVNTDAFAPSIAVIGHQTVAPGATLDVFNPFFEFESRIPLKELEYSFCLLRESNGRERRNNRHRLPGDCDFKSRFTVLPRTYQAKTALVLPLQGKIFVWEGHDFFAHHLRVPLGDSRVRALGIVGNSNEFASDFVYLGEKGLQYHDDARQLENWYSYGKPIYAPGNGVVFASANDVPESSFEDPTARKVRQPALQAGQDPKGLGNFVLIDHQNGEYSLLIHMKPGSVTVNPGDRVRQGQEVGRIGFSGDSIFPHLHYSLMDGPEVFRAWGVPAYFCHFRRIVGASALDSECGTADSGDLLESTSDYAK